MSKALLVALREYMENLKTQAFWIGIMAFPVILILAIGVPIWLEKKKDVRHYAVHDPTGWFLEAVEKRSSVPDLEEVYRYAVEKFEKGGDDFKELPEVLQKWAPRWATLDDEAARERIRGSASLTAALWGPEGEQLTELLEQTSDADLTAQLSAFGVQNITGQDIREGWRDFLSIKEWWLELSPDEAGKIGSGISRSRYLRVDVSDSGRDPEERLKRMLSTGELFAYFVIGSDPMKSSEGCKYVSNNLTDTDLKSWFSRHASAAIQARRIAEANIDPEVARKIQEPIYFDARQVSDEGEETEVEAKDQMRQWAPVAFVYLLWLSVFMIAQALMTNTIEEKSNKIMEVLLSSVSPIQLMAGKIIGIAGTGLTMVASWVVFFFLCLKLLPVIFGQGPDIDLALIARDPIYISSFLAYYILGYLLLSAILVGIGSVCNSLKEAQNLMAPVTIIMIVPLVAMVPIGQDPNGTIAKVLSYIPPFTPFVMMNRAAGPPSMMEYVITTLLLLVSIMIALWAAAKVFRIGILMTGKPPKIGEILRWIRAPVGQIQARRE
jgi:ABC-2 type transport system permease protein